MKQEMRDIPIDVWRKVHAKWKYALETGWKNDIWCRCALCRHMGTDVYCRDCPLYEPGWCRGKESKSRLSLIYHNRKVCTSKFFGGIDIGINIIYFINHICFELIGNRLYRDEIEKNWNEDVEEFLEYIEPYRKP